MSISVYDEDKVLHPVRDVEKVYAFLGKMVEQLDDIVNSMSEDSFKIDMYGDDPAGVLGIVGTQNRGLYRQYNGPFIITDILATWNVPAPSASSEVKGSVAAPAANTVIVSTASFPAGTYQVQWSVELEGTVAVGTDDNNFNLNANSAVFAQSINPALDNVYPQATQIITLTTAGTIVVRNALAASAGSTYSASITVTPISAQNTTVTLQLGDRTLQFPSASGIQSLNNLGIEMQRDDVITLTVTPPQACHLEIIGSVKKRVMERTTS